MIDDKTYQIINARITMLSKRIKRHQENFRTPDSFYYNWIEEVTALENLLTMLGDKRTLNTILKTSYCKESE